MRISDWSSDVCSSDLNTRNTSARRQEANFVMDGKKIALLAGALIIAIATAFMARSMFASSGAPQATAANMQPQLDGPQVLVATRALPVGTTLGQIGRASGWERVCQCGCIVVFSGLRKKQKEE